MPPAFNLSQDQTLQFNLCFSDTAIGGHLLKNTDDSIFRWSRFNYLCRRLLLYFEHRDRSLGHITSNAHTYRLLIVKEFCPEALAAGLATPTNRCVCQQQRDEIMRCFVQIVNPFDSGAWRFHLSPLRFVFHATPRQGQNYSKAPRSRQVLFFPNCRALVVRVGADFFLRERQARYFLGRV